MSITVCHALDRVATVQAPLVAATTDQEPLVAAAADLAEPVVVAVESSVPFDMAGSSVAAVALLFDSNDGVVSNVDPILPVLSNDVVLVAELADDQGKVASFGIPLTDNHVDPLLDFEAWLNQPPQVSDFDVDGNDGNVLAFHANEVCVRKRSLVSSSPVHILRDIVRRLPVLRVVGNPELG
ncbi:hypothetical protein V6N13_124515 [Hibiscus sabdariffa]